MGLITSDKSNDFGNKNKFSKPNNFIKTKYSITTFDQVTTISKGIANFSSMYHPNQK